MNNWIKVLKSPPDSGTVVLGWVVHFKKPGGRFAVLRAVFDDDTDFVTDDDGSPLSYEWAVTHWTHLPSPPEKP